jgi:hypothetical protein
LLREQALADKLVVALLEKDSVKNALRDGRGEESAAEEEEDNVGFGEDIVMRTPATKSLWKGRSDQSAPLRQRA